MYIKKLTIESLGSLKNRSLDGFTPGINAIVGDNGTGKSTTRHALGYSLFGLPAKKDDEPRLRPSFWSELNSARRLEVVISDGADEVKITRESNDGKIDGGPHFQPQSGADIFTHFVGDTSAEDFDNIWSMSEYDLQKVDPAQSDTIKKILASRFGLNADPVSVSSSLTKKLNSLASKAKGSSGVGEAKKMYEEALEGYEKLTAQASRSFEATEKLDHIERSLAKKEQMRTQLQEEANHINNLFAEFKSINQTLSDAEAQKQRALEEQEKLFLQKPSLPNAEVLNRESIITINKNRLNDYYEQKQHLESLKEAKCKLVDTLKNYPETSFTFTEADAAFIAEEAAKLRDQRRDSARELEAHRGHIEDLEKQIDSLKETATVEDEPARKQAPWGIIIFTLLLCFAASGYMYISLSSLVASGLFAGIGVLLAICEYFFLKKTPVAQGSKPSPAAELENLLAQNKTQLASLDRAYDAAVTAWDDFIDRYFPEHKDLDFEEMYRHINNLPEKITYDQNYRELLQNISERSESYKSLEEQILHSYKICYPGQKPDDPHDIGALIAACVSRLNAEQNLRKANEAHANEVKANQELLTRIDQNLVHIQSARENIAQQLNCAPDECQGKLDERARELSEETEELNNRIVEESRSKGTFEETLRNSVSFEDCERAKAQLQDLEAIVEGKAHEMCVVSLASDLIKSTLSVYQKSKAPAIIEESNNIFRRITDGAYVRINFPESDEEALTVLDIDNNEFTADMLSVGTMRQLYLAIRLAVIKTRPKDSTHVPILFDEVLSSFDETRRHAAAREINALAQDHQVFYFSVRDDFKEHEITRDWNVINLPRS